MNIHYLRNCAEDYSVYNLIANSYFGMVSYTMLHYLTVRPTRPHQPRPQKPSRPTNRISARQVQNNLDAFINEQRQVNQVLLDFVAETRQFMVDTRQFIAEQRQFNRTIVSRVDNLVLKNKLVE